MMKMLHKSKTRRVFAFLCVMVMACAMLCVPALAAEELSGSGIADEINQATVTPEPTGGVVSDYQSQLYHQWGLDDPDNQINIKPVSTTEVNNWVERKGNDVASIVMTVGKAICVVGLLASIIFIVVGALGNKRTMTGGFIGFVLAVLAYVALTQYREIINLFSSWVMS